jgi:hypothetical protein
VIKLRAQFTAFLPTFFAVAKSGSHVGRLPTSFDFDLDLAKATAPSNTKKLLAVGPPPTVLKLILFHRTNSKAQKTQSDTHFLSIENHRLGYHSPIKYLCRGKKVNAP